MSVQLPGSLDSVVEELEPRGGAQCLKTVGSTRCTLWSVNTDSVTNQAGKGRSQSKGWNKIIVSFLFVSKSLGLRCESRLDLLVLIL